MKPGVALAIEVPMSSAVMDEGYPGAEPLVVLERNKITTMGLCQRDVGASSEHPMVTAGTVGAPKHSIGL